jgi:hypothetical protein
LAGSRHLGKRPTADFQPAPKTNPAEAGHVFSLKQIKRLSYLDGASRLIVEDVLVVI